MLLALSTGHKIGLAGTGAAFVVFALTSSFLLPRFNPNFPGRGRNWYLLLCFAFFLAMMSAVFVFGKESKASASASTTTQAAGNAANGKTLFLGKGCAACHTFKPAATTAKVGPDLDNLAQEAAGAKEPLDQFISDSITTPDKYIAPGFHAGTMPTIPLSSSDVADLVAFLSSSS